MNILKIAIYTPEHVLIILYLVFVSAVLCAVYSWKWTFVNGQKKLLHKLEFCVCSPFTWNMGCTQNTTTLTHGTEQRMR